MLPLTSDNCDPHVLRAKWMRAQVYMHALLRRYETLGVLPLTADNCDVTHMCSAKCMRAQAYLRLYYALLRVCECAIKALLRRY